MALRKPLIQIAGAYAELSSAADQVIASSVPGASVDPFAGHIRARASYNGPAALPATSVYWTYLGRLTTAKNIARALIYVTTAGAGSQLSSSTQIVLATSPLPPNGTAQTLTCEAVSGAGITSLTSAGAKTTLNASPWYAAAAGIHLWAGYHHGLTTTSPTLTTITYDLGLGAQLATTGVTASYVIAAGSTYSTAMAVAAAGVDFGILFA